MCQENKRAFDRIIQTALNDMPNKAEKLVFEVGRKTYVFFTSIFFPCSHKSNSAFEIHRWRKLLIL